MDINQRCKQFALEQSDLIKYVNGLEENSKNSNDELVRRINAFITGLTEAATEFGVAVAGIDSEILKLQKSLTKAANRPGGNQRTPLSLYLTVEGIAAKYYQAFDVIRGVAAAP